MHAESVVSFHCLVCHPESSLLLIRRKGLYVQSDLTQRLRRVPYISSRRNPEIHTLTVLRQLALVLISFAKHLFLDSHVSRNIAVSYQSEHNFRVSSRSLSTASPPLSLLQQ